MDNRGAIKLIDNILPKNLEPDTQSSCTRRWN